MRKRKKKNRDISKEFNSIINNIGLKQDIDFRELYDISIKHISGVNSIEVREDTLNRALVNGVRHNYTNYDNTLKTVYRLDRDNNSYYKIYKNEVLNSIQKQYPSLTNECDKQKTKLIMAKCIRNITG